MTKKGHTDLLQNFLGNNMSITLLFCMSLGHIPANADPTVTPDPERWLPQRERSYYKGKRKTKKGAIGKGTQGATTGSSEM